ncbi:MAG: hypothetical protein HY820_45190 [Acidobacteria bacterium]|nr:hypothetical protein [Acidobacteriota bacterium]
MHKLLFAFVLATATLLAGDASGKWSGNMRPTTGDGNDRPVTLILKQEGAVLTGSGGPAEEKQTPINPGKVQGDELNFTVNIGNGAVLTFKLKMSGDDITGDVQMARDGQTETGKVTLKRAKS